ncbi:MAG: cytochrome b N-terminal domain-containing protein [Deltaproteobacteria bacterium]|nr:cytochrome b N-terminal domain-containing protein [Deltaproteobacteria bacterium]
MWSIRSFLSHRLGWDQYLKPFMEKPLPANLSWTVTFGSLLVLLFIVQAATGIVLAMYYNPSPDHAYQAIAFITGEVSWGRILRGIHHYGASTMVVLVFTHMLVSFFNGAYKPPRELTWVTGVCLFLLTLGFGFTGYLLPWDQKAYWATVVGTNIPRQFPIIGKWITRILLAGDTVSGLTLTRFYAIHTLLLPALASMCIGIHIYLVRIHGISEPVSSSPMPAKPCMESEYRFFPEHLARASIVFTIVFSVVLLLAVFVDIPIEDVAGTLDPDYQPRPEWYFMWLFQLLTFFSGKLEIVGSLLIPIGGIFLLISLPFISRSTYRNPADRPVEIAAGVAVLAGILYLGITGVANSRPYGETVSIADRSLTESETAGLTIFVEKECAYCHQILGRGGRRQGPDLSNMVAKDRTGDELVRFIKDPQAVSAWSIMPKYDLDEKELEALADFILSLDFSRYDVKTVSREDVLNGTIK